MADEDARRALKKRGSGAQLDGGFCWSVSPTSGAVWEVGDTHARGESVGTCDS